MPPSEFQYWSRLHQLRHVRAVCRTLGFDPFLEDRNALAFAEDYFRSDPLAEAFVDQVYLEQGHGIGRGMIEQSLASGVGSVVDAPASLVALFEDFDTEPDWLDWTQVELGARVFRRYGVAVFRFAGAITLASYLEPSVAKPLILSGAYHGASARHRFLETASFWIDVSEPNGLARGADGRAAVMRVRMMHVFVRRMLERDPKWKRDAWGVPISQSDAVLTLMGGSVAPGLALQLLGYRTTRDEIRALMHFWRYVGHLIGVRPSWYPRTIRDALRLSLLVALNGTRNALPDGRVLARAYMAAFDGSEGQQQAAFVRLFLPVSIRRLYGLVGLPSPTGLLLSAPARFVFETMRLRSVALDEWHDSEVRRKRREWLQHHLNRPVEYATQEPVRM